MTSVAWFLLLLLSLLWGGSFFFVEIALRELGPLTIVTARVTVGALALLLYLRIIGHHLPRESCALVRLLIMGALNNVIPFTLLVWAQVRLTAGEASILNATTPLFTVLFAYIATTDERVSAGKALGVVVGFCGVAIFVGSEVLLGLGGNVVPQLAAIGAALSYAIASIYGRRLRGLPVSVAAAGMLIGSSLILIPLTLYIETPFATVPEGETIAAIFALGLLSSALAYLIYFRLLIIAGSTNLTLVTLLVPVTAILLGVMVLDERIPLTAYMGMCVIFLGLIIIDGRVAQAAKGRFQV